MKGILVVIDGLSDLPNKQLGEMTPLEAADTPNLDFFATRGEMGWMHPVRPGFIPESDEAIVSIFGNELISSSRGWLEAKGTDIKLTRGDLALRTNFATIDSLEEGNIIDRRAGRTLTTSEAEAIAKTLNEEIDLPCKFIFEPTVQHRGVLVFRGGLSDSISGNDLTYVQGKSKIENKIKDCTPLSDSDNAEHTADIVNQFLRKSAEILSKHPVNLARQKKGLLPANYILARGAGIEPPKLKQYKKWLSLNYMPLEIGFSKASGMEVLSFDYPRLKSMDSYENLWDGLKKACKFFVKSLKKNYKDFDYVYIHVKETDLPGHDNKPLEKKEMIEYIDKTLFHFLRKLAPPNNITIVVTADHSTPCKLKSHSADPVPVLLYNGSNLKEKKFSEKEARKGTLRKIEGKDFLRRIGFTK